MKKLFSIPKYLFSALIRHPQVAAAIGVFSLICLVWFAGPFYGLVEGEDRLVFIVGILFIWIMFLLFARIQEGRGAKFIEESLNRQAEEQMGGIRPDRKEEIKALRGEFEKAVSALKRSKLGKGRRGSTALYALPWYMFIGPPASGKSTMLQNSGLQFPYLGSAGRGIQGIGGTRNCDWWFTNQAILLDTAGRYVTEDEDREEWYGFLDLLKKYRKRKPINGVIAAISIADLLQADDEELELHAKNIRSRADELTDRLGIAFPVYLVFTKCDLFHGFVEFFEDLNRSGREQIWGCTFPKGETSGLSAHARFETEFKKICGVLDKRRMLRLASARGSQKVRNIYGFPLQFASVRERLCRFVETLFQENPYRDNQTFRGFYFSSGTQEGTPIDRIMNAVSRASGLEDVLSQEVAGQKEAKSYFIKDLFTDVIFPDQILAGTSSAISRQRGQIRLGIFFLTILSVLVSLTGFSFSFLGNRRLIGSVRAISLEATQMDIHDEEKLAINIKLLDRLRQRLDQLASYEEGGVPSRLGFGLYRGSELYSPLKRLYFDRFKQIILTPVQKSIEAELSSFSANPNKRAASGNERYYSHLKAYLMMSNLTDLDESFLRPWLQRIWERFLLEHYGKGSIPEGLENDSNLQIAFYTHRFAEVGTSLLLSKPRLVRNVRRVLLSASVEERLYHQMLKEASEDLDPLTLNDVLEDNQQDLLTSKYKIPGFFTSKGREEYLGPIMAGVLEGSGEESRVLGLTESIEGDMEVELRKRYFDDYASHWWKFLESVALRPEKNLSELENQFEILATEDSPFVRLMIAVDRNTAFDLVEGSADSGFAPGFFQKVKKGLHLDQGEDQEKTSSAVAGLSNPVSLGFQSLHKFVALPGKKEEASSLAQYIAELGKVQQLLQEISRSDGSGNNLTGFAREIVSTGPNELVKAFIRTGNLLRKLDPRPRRVVGQLFLQPYKMVAVGVMNRALAVVNDRWRAEVYQQCLQSIEGRYPFKKGGEDAAINDVTDFFHPENGALWGFFQENIKPFVKKHGDHWKLRGRIGVKMPLSSNFLIFLKRAKGISESVFQKGGQSVKFTFDLYPHPSPSVSESILQIDGKSLRYRNEPQEWHKYTWPGTMGAPGASLQVKSKGVRLARRFSGRWGLFKLLDQGQLHQVTPNKYNVVWQLRRPDSKIVRIQYDLRARSFKNPLREGTFSGFGCLDRLG